jgi:hypothetical protein
MTGQYAEKLETMNLRMLSRQMGPNGYNILIHIWVPLPPAYGVTTVGVKGVEDTKYVIFQ